MPSGILGTNADLLIDIAVLSNAAIFPVLAYSYYLTRKRRYKAHKKLQVVVIILLAIIVTLFEIDLRLQGGIGKLLELIPASSLELLKKIIIFHLIIAFSTTIVWLVLLIFSLKNFSNNAFIKNGFADKHRLWGKLGMIGAILTALSGISLYIVGFA